MGRILGKRGAGGKPQREGIAWTFGGTPGHLETSKWGVLHRSGQISSRGVSRAGVRSPCMHVLEFGLYLAWAGRRVIGGEAGVEGSQAGGKGMMGGNCVGER